MVLHLVMLRVEVLSCVVPEVTIVSFGTLGKKLYIWCCSENPIYDDMCVYKTNYIRFSPVCFCLLAFILLLLYGEVPLCVVCVKESRLLERKDVLFLWLYERIIIFII